MRTRGKEVVVKRTESIDRETGGDSGGGRWSLGLVKGGEGVRGGGRGGGKGGR